MLQIPLAFTPVATVGFVLREQPLVQPQEIVDRLLGFPRVHVDQLLVAVTEVHVTFMAEVGILHPVKFAGALTLI